MQATKQILMMRFMLSVYALEYLISLEKQNPVIQLGVFLIYVLYRYILKINPTYVYDPNRDRYVQSKGHAVEALYIVLSEMEYFDPQLLDTYLSFGSNFIGHVTKKVPGIEQSTGSLGHGLFSWCGNGSFWTA